MEEKENKPRNVSIEERIREANIAAEQEEVEKMIQDLNYKRDQHISKWEAIAAIIEKKKREADFLRDLKPDDLMYMMHKKKVYAAKWIQVSLS